MKLVEKICFRLSSAEYKWIYREMETYIDTVNFLVRQILDGKFLAVNLSTAMFEAPLPSAIKCQCIRDANSVVNKYKSNVRKYENKCKKHSDTKKKPPKVPTLKLPVYHVNNQNFRMEDDKISFPMLVDGKSKRISFRLTITERQQKLLEGKKLGLLRITIKNGKLAACVQYEEAEEITYSNNDKIMGIDIGLKCPAVSFDSNKRIRFYGNGRKNRYIRRKFFQQRRKLQRKKKYRTIKRMKHKEQCIMKDSNHKISRSIINEAVRQGVSVIKMERLKNIRKNITRKTTRTSRKNNLRKRNRFVNSWSFGQLQNFIAYKAKLVGIRILYVNPKNTSKECPVCHTLNKAKDREYLCACGFHKHRDVVGAMNICRSTKVVGNRQPA